MYRKMLETVEEEKMEFVPLSFEENYLNRTDELVNKSNDTLKAIVNGIERCDFEVKLLKEMDKNKKYGFFKNRIHKEKLALQDKKAELLKVQEFYKDMSQYLHKKLEKN